MGGLWVSLLIVFMASCCTMVLELVAGRILAPFIGVSLYTWTSIIGVCLAGISAGNFLGGVLADKAGCIAGRATAQRFGWKLGDRIPIRGAIYPGSWRRGRSPGPEVRC